MIRMNQWYHYLFKRIWIFSAGNTLPSNIYSSGYIIYTLTILCSANFLTPCTQNCTNSLLEKSELCINSTRLALFGLNGNKLTSLPFRFLSLHSDLIWWFCNKYYCKLEISWKKTQELWFEDVIWITQIKVKFRINLKKLNNRK